MGGIWQAIGLGVVLYAAVVLAMYLSQRSMMYHPTSVVLSPEAAGVPEMRRVTVSTLDGLALPGWYAPAAQNQPTVLFLHGNAGNYTHRGFKARPFLDAGYGVMLASWRGYGGAEGSPTEAGLKEDARAAQAFLEEAGVPSGRTVYYGESLGSGPAVWLAARTPTLALVLESPFTSAVDVGRRHHPWLPVGLLMKDRFESLPLMQDIDVPVMVLHGRKDIIVPPDMGETMLEAARGRTHGFFPEHADHNDLFDHGAAQAVLDFLESVDAKAPLTP